MIANNNLSQFNQDEIIILTRQRLRMRIVQ